MILGGYRVPRIGYGAAFRVDGRPATRDNLPDRAGVHRLLRQAVESGARLFDTADSYGPELSEELLAGALYPYLPDLLLATKGGVIRSGPAQTRFDGRPTQLRAACEASLRRLRVEAVGLYQLHWRDPEVPMEDQVGALADLVAAGKVRHVGLCNVGLAELEVATAITPIAAVQCRFGLADPGQAALVEHCAARGIAFLAHGPLGVLRTPGGGRAERLATVARRHGATPTQVALAWILHRAPNTVAVPGTLRPDHLAENLRAARLALSMEEVAWLAG